MANHLQVTKGNLCAETQSRLATRIQSALRLLRDFEFPQFDRGRLVKGTVLDDMGGARWVALGAPMFWGSYAAVTRSLPFAFVDIFLLSWCRPTALNC